MTRVQVPSQLAANIHHWPSGRKVPTRSLDHESTRTSANLPKKEHWEMEGGPYESSKSLTSRLPPIIIKLAEQLTGRDRQTCLRR